MHTHINPFDHSGIRRAHDKQGFNKYILMIQHSVNTNVWWGWDVVTSEGASAGLAGFSSAPCCIMTTHTVSLCAVASLTDETEVTRA